MCSALVILPSYNSGELLPRTMQAARALCNTVWAVVDGSTDGSAQAAQRLERNGIRVLALQENVGKGGAVMVAFREALAAGFTHAIVMDADGQHPAGSIAEFLRLAADHPDDLIAGVPVFGPDAPAERIHGRRIGNFFAQLETWGHGAKDSLFGFRLYPIRPALEILESTASARRFAFDTVLAVRLAWAGISTINVPVPVRYPPRDEGGVTHFHYVRDNLLLASVHLRLGLEMLRRIPQLIRMGVSKS